MKNKKGFALLPVLLVVLALVVVGAGAYTYYNAQKTAAPQAVACTMEAKLCPDGSSVGRSGPNCEFTACPQVASKNTVVWTLKDAGTNKDGFPQTSVSVAINGVSQTIGTYTGSCIQIGSGAGAEQSGLLPNEISAVQCWYAGSGDEIGVFKEGTLLVLKAGQLDEGGYNIPGTRGNFKVISTAVSSAS